jgi:hypothetical protein
MVAVYCRAGSILMAGVEEYCRGPDLPAGFTAVRPDEPGAGIVAAGPDLSNDGVAVGAGVGVANSPD